jgi:metacaspase-1
MSGRALCVGINTFENLPTANWLNGCVNDAEDLASLWTSRFGFADNDVTTLTDAQATKAAVMGALTDLVERAKRGEVDQIVFALSSHGTQVPDANGDEIDHADEAFAMYDINSEGDRWDPATVLLDDELHALFTGVPKAVLVEVLLDTCHSGTGLKSLDFLPGRRPRFVPPPTSEGLDTVEEVDPVGLRDLVKGSRLDSTPVLFAACRPDQTASDAHFEGRYNGAFTHFLVEALTADQKLPRSGLLTAVSKGLRAGRFTQRAQLEAPTKAKKLAFGSRW